MSNSHQTINQDSSENTNQENMKKPYLGIQYSNSKKTKENIFSETRVKNFLRVF